MCSQGQQAHPSHIKRFLKAPPKLKRQLEPVYFIRQAVFHRLKFWLKTLIPTAKLCISHGNKHEVLICLDFNNLSSEASNG